MGNCSQNFFIDMGLLFEIGYGTLDNEEGELTLLEHWFPTFERGNSNRHDSDRCFAVAVECIIP